MEHQKARKKLNDYSKGFIAGKEEESEIEGHLKMCEICRRELAMWQDVNERQKGLDSGKQDARLAAKIKEINREREKDVNMSPAAKRLNYVANTLKSPAAMIIGTITCVIFGLALLLMVVKKEVSPLFHFFMIIGGLAMVFVVIRSYWIKKKK